MDGRKRTDSYKFKEPSPTQLTEYISDWVGDENMWISAVQNEYVQYY